MNNFKSFVIGASLSFHGLSSPMQGSANLDSRLKTNDVALAQYPASNDCLMAYKAVDNIDHFIAYKTGPDASICFGIITQATQKELERVIKTGSPQPGTYYIMRVLTKAKLSSHMPLDLTKFYRSSDGPTELRKATSTERELVRKAIRHNGARFLGFKTDGDSLQLWESSKE